MKKFLVVSLCLIVLLSVTGIFGRAHSYSGHHFPRHHGCFIASAAYGSDYNSQVDILYEFRDKHLLTNSAGRAFAEYYYENSPPIARFIEENDWSKPVARWILLPVVGACYWANMLG